MSMTEADFQGDGEEDDEEEEDHPKPVSALGELFAEEDRQLQRQLSQQQQSAPTTVRERLKEVTVYRDLPPMNKTLSTGGGDSITGLRADLREKDKLLLDFSSIASTLPWSGSINTETPAPVTAPTQPEAQWLLQGPEPKTRVTSTIWLGPAKPLRLTSRDRVKTPESSTPHKPAQEPWTVVPKGAHPPPLPLPSSDLPLQNRFDILSLHEFPPVSGVSQSPLDHLTSPSGLIPQRTRRQHPAEPGPTRPSRTSASGPAS
ncbi:hypothetical protein ABVT39_020419 [Epinephelus coioides]